MAERVFPAQPISTAAGRVIASPFQFVTTGEDNLRVGCANSQSGVRIAIQGRRLVAGGTIEAFAFAFVPTSDRTFTTQDFPLGAGAILNVTVYASAGAPRMGQTFMKIDLVRGFSGATILLGVLLQGYVTGSQALSWPGSPIQSSLEGGGYSRDIVGTLPAVGAESRETVPTGARWNLVTWRGQVVFAAGGPARRIFLTFETGATRSLIVVIPGTFAGNDAPQPIFGQGLPYETQFSTAYPQSGFPIPLILLAGTSIVTVIGAIQPGDYWLAPIMGVQEWLEVV